MDHLVIVVGNWKGKPLRSSRLKRRTASGGLGIPPCIVQNKPMTDAKQFYGPTSLEIIVRTKYCNINGHAIEGSIFPTITTVKVDGSLKQLLKYSQALYGLTFRRSLYLIGYKKILYYVSHEYARHYRVGNAD